jgi:hypothetical protein
MPTSNLALWPDILAAVDQARPRRLLDVGPGHGKAAVLLREYLAVVPDVIDAVEAWAPYIGAFGLETLYDHVYAGDVCAETWTRDGVTISARERLGHYDVVLLGDVIEHIPTDAAMSLLTRIPGRVVICTPTNFFDNDPSHIHPPTEKHVSLWTQQHWELVSCSRALEVCYTRLGGWIVRLGPAAP